MSYIEVWFKTWCPECKVVNWVCDGDPSDLTGVDIDAIKCWKCSQSWWLDEHNEFDLWPEDSTPEDCAEEGKEHP